MLTAARSIGEPPRRAMGRAPVRRQARPGRAPWTAARHSTPGQLSMMRRRASISWSEARSAMGRAAAISSRRSSCPTSCSSSTATGMGTEKGGPLEKPVHEVCVSSYRMDAKEVTQVAFQSIMDDNPSHFPGGNLPVDSVTWMEAKEYCKKLDKRLPTEAEWEYAARAGAQTNFYWGDDYDATQANFCDGSCELNVRVADALDGFKNTAPVGSFSPNSFGLYDMAGNVSEWVFDSFDPSYYIMSPKDNPSGWVPLQTEKVQLGPEQDFLAKRSASRKIVRGGAWESHPSGGWSATRKIFYPGAPRAAAWMDEFF